MSVFFRLYEADLSSNVPPTQLSVPEPAGTGAVGILALFFHASHPAQVYCGVALARLLLACGSGRRTRRKSDRFFCSVCEFGRGIPLRRD